MREIPGRAAWFTIALVAGFAVISFQLYKLTVLQSPAWRLQAEQNMLRELPMHGPRGIIADRKGRSLATSEPAFAAVLINQDPAHVEVMLPELALLLTRGNPEKATLLKAKVLERVVENKELGRQYEPLTIMRNLDPSVVALVLERRQEFPGVILVTESARFYPHGEMAGALLGHVGQIGDELQQTSFAGYHMDEVIGKAGIELAYEHLLRGKPGSDSVVVDPLGRPIKAFDQTPPIPGRNLQLTLDLDLQRVAEEALIKQMEWIREQKNPQAKPTRGTLVVQEISTGAILAMASVPTYDPNRVTSDWEELQKHPEFSMLNWAIQGLSPGSTYKMATGLAGLEGGVLSSNEKIECPPVYWRYGNPKNWTSYNQGPADIARALSISCNPFFYEVGYRLGIDALAEFVGQFGFGESLGIDLPNEQPGRNPTKQSYGDRWQEGHVVSVAIGQGDVEVTPLQLANYTAAIASGGIRYRPYLVAAVHDPSGALVMLHEPERLASVVASDQSWMRIQEGLRQAVTSPEGTAHAPFLGFPISVAGKTGSAETGGQYANALSVAYAPFDQPQIAVSVSIEGGATGSWTTPVIRRVMAEYFGIKEEIPIGVPTYRD